MKTYRTFPGPLRRWWGGIGIGTTINVSGLTVCWDWVMLLPQYSGGPADLAPGWIVVSDD